MLRLLVILTALLAWTTGCSKEPVGFDEQAVLMKAPEFQKLREANRGTLASVQAKYTTSQLSKALRIVSQTLVGRDPSPEEQARTAEGVSGYEEVVKAYLESPEFLVAQRKYYQAFFEMGGQMNGIDYDEPSNLALFLISGGRDFREILTADYCVNASLQKVPCSSFRNAADAPKEAAGVLTTRAFLQKFEAPFNFRRVEKTFQMFSCRSYPDSSDEGLTEAEISEKVKTFACKDCDTACYTCHRTMNPRAAMFYRFDRKGFFNPTPNPSPGAGDITVTDTGAASTVADVLTAQAKPRYHGREVANLREYAILTSRNRLFRDCLAQRLTNQLLGKAAGEALPAQFQSVRDDVSYHHFNVKAILLDIAKHPAFVLR